MLEPDLVLRGRYRIVETLGRGGMGAVYLATDQTFGSTVAIKQTLCDGPDLEKAFQREARLLNGLRHAALPVVIDYFTEERGQFLVMQYIPGDDFGALLDQRKEPWAAELVMEWAEQLLDALQYLHEHDPQVIHRDIKPRNLKLTPRGEVVLLDFGLSKSTPAESHVAGTSVSVLGYTPHYAPFEQIQGQGTDPRSDLFALAATLYHLLTATLPPDAMVRALTAMEGKPDPLQPAHIVSPAVPVALGELVHRAMAMGRDQRPASAAAMRAALRVLRAGAPSAAVAPDGSSVALAATIVAPPPAEAASLVAAAAASPRSRPWLPLAGIAGVVAAIGLVLAMPGRSPSTSAAARAVTAAADHDVADDAGLAPIAIAPAERTFAFQIATVAADGTLTRDQRQARSYREDLGKGIAIEMVAIPGGTFQMGNATGEYPDEMPQHAVTLAPFYLSRYEVTQAQWRAVATGLPKVSRVLAADPSGFKGDDLPVEQVSWADAIEFCARLSRKTHHVYHLPSEAEWEYAARAGSTTPFAFGATLTPAVANFDASVPFAGAPAGPAATRTVQVGSFGVANAFGLFDMHGNVAEWCLGEYHSNYVGAPADGRPWTTDGDTDRHVLRGGSWDDLAVDCRSANRYSYPREGRQHTIGFRLAMSMGGSLGSATAAAPASGPAEAVAAAAAPVAPPDPRFAEQDPVADRNDPRVDRRGPRWSERPAAARVLRRRFPDPAPAPPNGRESR